MEMYSDNPIERQRKIGKQLVLINMIHVENDKEIKGYFTNRLTMDDLSRWFLLEEEILDLIDATHCIYDHGLAHDASMRLVGYKHDFPFECMIYLEDTFLEHGNTVLSKYDPIFLSEYSIREASANYANYQHNHPNVPVNEKYATPAKFRHALEYYVEYTVSHIREVISEGYDWDVIKEMLRCDLTQDKFEELDSLFPDKDTANADTLDINDIPVGEIPCKMSDPPIFHSVLEESKPVLISLLGSLLHMETGDIHSVTIIKPVDQNSTSSDAEFTDDFNVIINENILINLSMQISDDADRDSHSMIHLGKCLNNSLDDEDYDKSLQAHQICIINRCIPDSIPIFYSTYHFVNDKTGKVFAKNVVFHTLNLAYLPVFI